MRITNQLREQIISDICHILLDKEHAAIDRREQQLALQCYNHVFSKKHRDAMNELPRGWLPEDRCLRFNIGGMDARLKLKELTRVPFTVNLSSDQQSSGRYRDDCQRLGNISDDDIKQKFLDWHADKEALVVRKAKISNDTKAMLDSVQTYAQLEKNWPEGLKFYSKYKPKHGDSQLPAIRVAELNKTLGLAN